MRREGAPSIVPAGLPDTTYLVVDCLGGNLGCVWREADVGATDLDTVIADLLSGQYPDPLCVVAFNTSEGWSRDVTADIAAEIQRRSDLAGEDVPSFLEDLVHLHVTPERQLSLRLSR